MLYKLELIDDFITFLKWQMPTKSKDLKQNNIEQNRWGLSQTMISAPAGHTVTRATMATDHHGHRRVIAVIWKSGPRAGSGESNHGLVKVSWLTARGERWNKWRPCSANTTAASGGQRAEQHLWGGSARLLWTFPQTSAGTFSSGQVRVLPRSINWLQGSRSTHKKTRLCVLLMWKNEQKNPPTYVWICRVSFHSLDSDICQYLERHLHPPQRSCKNTSSTFYHQQKEIKVSLIHLRKLNSSDGQNLFNIG